MYKTLHLMSILAVVVVLQSSIVQAQQFDRKNGSGDQFILRSAAQDIAEVAGRYELEIVHQIRDGAQAVALVRLPAGVDSEAMTNLLLGDSVVSGFEPAQVASLPEQSEETEYEGSEGDFSLDLLRQGTFSSPCFDAEFSSPGWSGYASQWAAERLNLHEAQLVNQGCGLAVLAVIDTGVDPEHELLKGSVIPGFDFILNQAGYASDWSNVDGSITAILDGSITAILDGNAEPLVINGSITAILDGSITAILDGEELPPAFGHGTMVAGIARLAAPGAEIMPLRVFDGYGHGHLYDIIRAIHFAVKEGADVINMSFSTPSDSRELERAIEYATHRGVTCVAAVGNQGQQVLVYPAAYEKSLGIASTGSLDELSQYSNFGPQLVDLGAPGEAIISSYPGGLYAAGWGTSFATPFVAGTAALISKGGPNGKSVAAIFEALIAGAELGAGSANELGVGRLDMLASVNFMNQ